MRRLRRTHRPLRAPLALLGDARAPCLGRTWAVSDDRRTARSACVAEEPAEPAIEARPQDCGRRRCRAPVLFDRNRRVRLPLKLMASGALAGVPRLREAQDGAGALRRLQAVERTKSVFRSPRRCGSSSGLKLEVRLELGRLARPGGPSRTTDVRFGEGRLRLSEDNHLRLAFM